MVFPLLVILQPLLWKALGGARGSRAGDTEALLAEHFAMKTSNVLRKEWRILLLKQWRVPVQAIQATSTVQ